MKKRLFYSVFIVLISGFAVIVFFWLFFLRSDDRIYSVLSSRYEESYLAHYLKRSSDQLFLLRHNDFPAKVFVTDVDRAYDDKRGVAVTAGGDSYFYMFSALSQHAVINDVIAAQPILVAYCTTCETAVIASRFADGQEYNFRGTNYLWDGGLLMTSEEDSLLLWSAISGEEIVENRLQLTFLPFDISTLGDFRDKNPHGLVYLE